MSKDAWQAFLRWLNQASDDELARKHARCVRLLAKLTDVQFRADMRRIIRLIEEEQLIRIGIHQRMSAGSKSPE